MAYEFLVRDTGGTWFTALGLTFSASTNEALDDLLEWPFKRLALSLEYGQLSCEYGPDLLLFGGQARLILTTLGTSD